MAWLSQYLSCLRLTMLLIEIAQVATSVEVAPNTTHAVVGTDAVLSCPTLADNESLSAYWRKGNCIFQSCLVGSSNKGCQPSDPQRYLMDSNFSLHISHVQVADSGLYSCQISYKNRGNHCSSVQLNVTSLPRSTLAFPSDMGVTTGRPFAMVASADQFSHGTVTQANGVTTVWILALVNLVVVRLTLT